MVVTMKEQRCRNREDAALRRLVIVADDGIATGLTMRTALKPLEVVMAVPVASRDMLERFRPPCDRVVCLLIPDYLGSVSQYYGDFIQVESDDVVRKLRTSRITQPPAGV